MACTTVLWAKLLLFLNQGRNGVILSSLEEVMQAHDTLKISIIRQDGSEDLDPVFVRLDYSLEADGYERYVHPAIDWLLEMERRVPGMAR